MTRAIPRLTFVSVRPDDASTACALGVLTAAKGRGLQTAAIVIGADRDIPRTEHFRALGEVTGCAVQRLDPRLMAAPSLQRIVQRAAAESDLAAIIVFGAADGVQATRSGLLDVLAAIMAPPVLCVDAEGVRDANVLGHTLDAVRFLGTHAPPNLAAPIVLLSEAPGERRAERIEETSRRPVLATLPRSVRGGSVELTAAQLDSVIEHAERAPTLPPPVVHRRRHVRARIGLVLDDCFDLYDEESLVQFEVAGAELVALSALDGEVPIDLEGLIIGDGRVERHSTALAEARGFRTAIRDAVDAGVPTIASGGGYAYLSRGLRTLSGALHPFAGVIDAEAIAIASPLPRGHVDVEFTADTIVGSKGTRLRGYVQRAWLMRGLPRGERGVYETRSGPPDEGCGRKTLFCSHFRPYWPSCAESSIDFVDACVAFAAARGVECAEDESGTP